LGKFDRMDNQQDISIKQSFFDDAVIDNYTFWKKKASLKKHLDTRLMESNLFRKSSRTNFWKSRYYILYEDRLAYYKNGRQAEEQEEQGYCLIQNMRVQAISHQSENTTDKDKDKEKEERYGIRLIHNQQSFELYARAKDVQDKWIKALERFCVFTHYSDSFVNIKAIGKGSFARVYLAKRKSDNADYAVKTFAKDLLISVDKAKPSLINEINVMRKLEHESVIRLFNIYESDNHIYLVLELLNGGELFDRIREKGQYNENDASILMKKLLSALVFMHSKGIMHRDIKPENLILKDSENDWDVKIADFGLSQFLQANEYLFTRCGTPGYVAPEILADEKYDEKVDVFSAGVILYILLTGGSPFYSESYSDILRKNQDCQINYNFREFGHRISPPAVDLMKKMLVKDPKQRITAQEALEHEWIAMGGAYMSPQTNTPIYLLLAQENMKKIFQEEHGFNFKAMNDIERELLQRSVHAPSPLITGRVESIADSSQTQFIWNSPDAKLNAALVNRQRLEGIKSPQGRRDFGRTPTREMNYNMAMNGNMMNPDINKFSKNMNQQMFVNQSNKQTNTSNSSSVQNNSSIKKQGKHNPELARKALNAQGNLLKYLQTPKSQPRNNMNNFVPQQNFPQQQQFDQQSQFYQQQFQQTQYQQLHYQQFQQYQYPQQIGFQQSYTQFQQQQQQQLFQKKAKDIKNTLKQFQ